MALSLALTALACPSNPEGTSPEVATSEVATSEVATSEGRLAALPSAVDEFVDRTDFQGVVLVVEGDQILYERAFGFSSIEDAEATSPATRYQLGSITKWISSLLVLDAVDRGELALDEPVATYLPEYRADTGQRLALHHLIAHRSGLPNDIIAAIQSDPNVLDASLPLDEGVERFASGDLLFEPGERFDYSHSNWILVKAVLERVTGLSYRELVEQRLVRPLELSGTGVADGDFGSVPQIAHSYGAVDPPERAPARFPAYLEAAGGVYSTAPDLVALADAVYGGDLLSPDSVAKLDTVTSPEEGYAYGGRVRTMTLGGAERLLAWHTGSNGPSKSRLTRVLPNGPTIVVLNHVDIDHEETGALTEVILEAIL